VKRLFADAKKQGGFKLFFSFDHGPGILTKPNQYAAYVKKWIKEAEYFTFNDKSVVSTFSGEDVTNTEWANFKEDVQSVRPIAIIPGFYKGSASSAVFNTRASLDGIFNWNSWPDQSAGRVAVSNASDVILRDAAHKAGKLFMMGISPVQFKHMSKEFNWYRRGEDNLENRFGQALQLQPDIIQLQTWNDGGEGHYMGNVWPEPMTNSPTIRALVNGYDHTGYWQVLESFIKAWKRGDKSTKNMVPTNGKDIQGTFWHHTLTVEATCGGNGANQIPKAQDITKIAENAVSGIVLVAPGKTGLVAVVNVGTKGLGRLDLEPGYNKFKFSGLVPGKVQLEVWRGSTMIGGGYGPNDVSTLKQLCFENQLLIS
jgi:glucan endo-1,3-alpha-glucosidase